MLDASIEPCAAPAPTTVCNSSMKRIISPEERCTSEIADFKRSSNSPRKREPAIIAPKSREITFLPIKISGTSLSAIFWANPSTIAVLPTPASPIRTGLFFVRRERTWITRSISSSLPMTGSSLFSCAKAVRSRENFSNVR